MPEDSGVYGGRGIGWGHITVFNANRKEPGQRERSWRKEGPAKQSRIPGAMVGRREGEAEVVWARVEG